MDFQICPIMPIDFKVPTYVPMAPKQEDPITGVVNLFLYGANLAATNPKKAEEFAKACLAIGAVGAGIWVLAKLLSY